MDLCKFFEGLGWGAHLSCEEKVRILAKARKKVEGFRRDALAFIESQEYLLAKDSGVTAQEVVRN